MRESPENCGFFHTLFSIILNYKQHFFFSVKLAKMILTCSSEKMFFKNEQISQGNTCVGVFFNNVAGLKACNFIKKWLQHMCVPAKFAKFLRTPFLRKHLQWLLLILVVTNRFAFLDYTAKRKETYRFKPHHRANSVYLACAYLKPRQTSMMEIFRGNS